MSEQSSSSQPAHAPVQHGAPRNIPAAPSLWDPPVAVKQAALPVAPGVAGQVQPTGIPMQAHVPAPSHGMYPPYGMQTPMAMPMTMPGWYPGMGMYGYQMPGMNPMADMYMGLMYQQQMMMQQRQHHMQHMMAAQQQACAQGAGTMAMAHSACGPMGPAGLQGPPMPGMQGMQQATQGSMHNTYPLQPPIPASGAQQVPEPAALVKRGWPPDVTSDPLALLPPSPSLYGAEDSGGQESKNRVQGNMSSTPASASSSATNPAGAPAPSPAGAPNKGAGPPPTTTTAVPNTAPPGPAAPEPPPPLPGVQPIIAPPPPPLSTTARTLGRTSRHASSTNLGTAPAPAARTTGQRQASFREPAPPPCTAGADPDVKGEQGAGDAANPPAVPSVAPAPEGYVALPVLPPPGSLARQSSALHEGSVADGSERGGGATPRADGPKNVIYVSARRAAAILRRRAARARLEASGQLPSAVRVRKPYLHQSRHDHAQRRVRGPGGRFLSTAEKAAMLARIGSTPGSTTQANSDGEFDDDCEDRAVAAAEAGDTVLHHRHTAGDATGSHAGAGKGSHGAAKKPVLKSASFAVGPSSVPASDAPPRHRPPPRNRSVVSAPVRQDSSGVGGGDATPSSGAGGSSSTPRLRTKRAAPRSRPDSPPHMLVDGENSAVGGSSRGVDDPDTIPELEAHRRELLRAASDGQLLAGSVEVAALRRTGTDLPTSPPNAHANTGSRPGAKRQGRGAGPSDGLLAPLTLPDPPREELPELAPLELSHLAPVTGATAAGGALLPGAGFAEHTGPGGGEAGEEELLLMMAGDLMHDLWDPLLDGHLLPGGARDPPGGAVPGGPPQAGGGGSAVAGAL